MNTILQPTDQIKKAWDLFDMDVQWKCPLNAISELSSQYCGYYCNGGTCDPSGRTGYYPQCSKPFADEIAALALNKYKDFGENQQMIDNPEIAQAEFDAFAEKGLKVTE